MKFCNNLTFAAFLSAATVVNQASSFTIGTKTTSKPTFGVRPLFFAAAPGGKNVVSFTSGDDSIHREEIDLDTMTDRELVAMSSELEAINERCTEDCTQTNPECDVQLKDERDQAILQIQAVLHDRSGGIDTDAVKEMVKTPWTHTIASIRKTVRAMEKLNSECTEEGNQTKLACDVAMKEDRDSAIETLNLFLKSVEEMLCISVSLTTTRNRCSSLLNLDLVQIAVILSDLE